MEFIEFKNFKRTTQKYKQNQIQPKLHNFWELFTDHSSCDIKHPCVGDDFLDRKHSNQMNPLLKAEYYKKLSPQKNISESLS